jgi:hypothetical protein
MKIWAATAMLLYAQARARRYLCKVSFFGPMLTKKKF